MQSLARILSPREAANHGVGLRDRPEESIYEQIRSRSIPGARGFTYVPEDRAFHSGLFESVSVTELLLDLVRKKLAAVMPVFAFAEGRLVVDSSFVARNGPPEVLQYLYKDAVTRSCHAVTTWLDKTEDLSRRLERDLAADFRAAQEESPDVDAPLDSESALLRPLSMLRAAPYVVRPHDSDLIEFARDMSRALVAANKVVPLGQGEFFMLRKQSVLDCYEIAVDSMSVRVYPRFEGDGDIAKQWKRIQKAESAYRANPINVPDSRFWKERAIVVRDSIAAKDSGARVPLAVRMILALAPQVDQAYRAVAAAQDEEQVEEFRSTLLNHGGDWRNMFRYVEPAERENIRPGVWSALRNHPELLSVKYERPFGPVFLFIARDKLSVMQLVAGMLSLPPEEHWRATSLKELIDAHNYFFKPLFSNPAFVSMYGKLLRTAYIRYMPVYSRVLLWFGVNWLQDMFFKRAKRSLSAHQQMLAQKNSRTIAVERLKARDRGESGGSIALPDIRVETIVEEMRNRYLESRIVPSPAEVAKAVGETDEVSFYDLLRKRGFKVISIGSAGNGVLFFPNSAPYKKYFNRVREILPEIVEKLTAECGPESIEAIRAQRLSVMLGERSEGSPDRRSEGSPDRRSEGPIESSSGENDRGGEDFAQEAVPGVGGFTESSL